MTKTRAHFPAAILAIAAAFSFGCGHRNIVSAMPQSVAVAPMPQPTPPPEPVASAAPPEPEPAPAPPAPPPGPLPAPGSKPPPPPPRPAPEPEPKPAPEPPPAPPQIAPALTPQQEANARRITTSAVQSAEKNLQVANGKNLNSTQKDLVEKVRGFLQQAHEAIMASDWVRAQNLASKAQILSVDLTKSVH